MNDIGPYRIQRELGRGGMGVVYQGRHRDTGQQVAIKTVLGSAPKARTRLRLEVASLVAISHPQVVAIVDDGVADERPWYAMEMVHGAPLRHHMASLSAPSEGSDTTATFEPGAAPSAATCVSRSRGCTARGWFTETSSPTTSLFASMVSR